MKMPKKQVFQSSDVMSSDYPVFTVAATREMRRIGRAIAPIVTGLAYDGWSIDQIFSIVNNSLETILFPIQFNFGELNKKAMLKQVRRSIAAKHGDEK